MSSDRRVAIAGVIDAEVSASDLPPLVRDGVDLPMVDVLADLTPVEASAGISSAATTRESSPVVVRLNNVGKCYHMYNSPADRLKQAFMRWKKKYYREFWAVQNVSMEVRRGEAIGIVGRNGSGKSTLLQIIAGTLAPTTGTVDIAGRVAALLELGSGFNFEFTGRENVYLNAAVLGFSKAEVDAKFDAIASFADIGEFIDQPVKTYSSGMLVRLAFAVQVQVEPDVLIVDEALAVGDALFQKRCYQRLDELRAKGVTLLFVSHDQESVRTLCDRAILLDHGKPVAYGSSSDVILEYRKLLHEDEKRYYAAQLDEKRASKRASEGASEAEGRAISSVSRPKSVRDASFGDLDAEVVRVDVLDGEGEPISYVISGDPMRIRVAVRVHKQLTRANIALRIRNKQGVKMYSWGTFNQDLAAMARGESQTMWHRTFSAGDEFSVEFACDCTLGTDLYEVQAAVVEELDLSYMSHRIVHWRDEAAFFQVAVQKPDETTARETPHRNYFGGVCDLRMRATIER
jgi:lipopolysaccharide transport system ATP-binding protein